METTNHKKSDHRRQRVNQAVLLAVIFVPAILVAFWGDFPERTQKPEVGRAASSTRELRAIFFDVGQGDSFLLRDAVGNDVLVDGGPSDTVVEKLGRYLPPTDRTIELLVLTHPHADHVNGLPEVLRRYRVERVLLSGVDHGTGAYREFREEIERQKIPVTLVATSTELTVGELKIKTLWPEESWERRAPPRDNLALGGGVNDTSVVLRASFGQTDFMLMGDASSAVEEELIRSGGELAAEVLKVGHHGSKYSTSRGFLRAVQPKIAVIQVGAKNRYGHPTLQTLRRLEEAGAKIYRNDRDGDVELSTDGVNLQVDSNIKSR
ncbi:MBL fold metallo-hydrolase [Patescibacteria group bacterium]|nr:MAG: MBL fold metallo-hydrolase [Patescibacteria group bacterium]